jgi:hypothetical protein
MNIALFYERAFEDAAFRREKLEEMRFLKIFSAGGFWISFALGFGLWLYSGISEGMWNAHLTPLSTTLLSAAVYSNCVNRIAALRAFEIRITKHQGESLD